MAKKASWDKKNAKDAQKFLNSVGKVVTGKKRRKKSTVEKILDAILK